MRASLTELKAICTKQTPSERSRGPEPPSRRLETPRSARIRTASAPRPVRVLLGSSRPSPELPCSWPSSGTSCFPSCERSGQSGSPSARSAPAPGEQEEPAPRRGVRVPLSRGCSHDLDAGPTPDGCPYRTDPATRPRVPCVRWSFGLCDVADPAAKAVYELGGVRERSTNERRPRPAAASSGSS